MTKRKQVEGGRVGQWFTEKPTEAGFYWFYGTVHGKNDVPPELFSVEVKSKTFVTMRGYFMHDFYPLNGVFCKAETPDLPAWPLEKDD